MLILLTFYEIIDLYFVKVKKTIEKINQGNPFSDLPATFSLNQHSEEDVPNNWYHGHEKLKNFLYKLQFFAHYNKHPTEVQKPLKIECLIFGQLISFNLFESKVKTTGKNMVRGKQILLSVNDNGKKVMPAYDNIMPVLCKYSSQKLGLAMLTALNSSNVDQTSQGLPQDIIRAASIFILLTHVCESAIPFSETIEEFERAIWYNFYSDYPNDKCLTIKNKTGRIPMADKITRSHLREVADGKVSFQTAFSEDNFVIRGKRGTSKGRTWVLENEDGSQTGELSDSDNES